MKKIIGFLLLVSIVFNSVIVITPTNIKAQEVDNVSEEMEETVESIEDKEICEDALSMIGKMVNAENCQNWDEYAQYWRAENCQFLKNALHNETYIKNRTGVSNVKSAKVVMCEKVTDSNQVDIVEYVDYQDVQVYLVGIDYEVYETQESFYDGVNYRYYIIGKENGTYKVLDVTEAQLDYLKDVVANEENGVVVYEAVKDVHIHTGSNSSLFETGYVDTRSTDKDSYGTLYQDRALSLSKQGYTYKKILKDAYDNSSQMGISNIGTISFSSFQ